MFASAFCHSCPSRKLHSCPWEKLHPALFPLHLDEEAAILFSSLSPTSEILRSTLMANFSAFFLFFRSLFFSRISLATDILVLRQQLLVLNRTVKRPNLR